MKRLTIIIQLLAGGLIGVTSVMGMVGSAGATSNGADFVPGFIISDGNFWNKNAMTPTQIETFLQQQVPNCDTNGNQYFVGTYNHVTYYAPPATPNIQRKNLDSTYPAPYTCMSQYFENTTTHQNNVAGNLDGTTGPNDMPTGGACDTTVTDSTFGDGVCSAAQIIYIAQENSGVSADVLITTLQKEEDIVTDDWPWWDQYKSAMGYGCPDSTPGQCDASYNGFYNQVIDAANQFDLYKAHPTEYNFQVGTFPILYHTTPSSCGTETVNILNQATAGLYNYTPYVPNQAALNNMYGSGDGCSSYGNRNFWRDYNDWFGASVNVIVARSPSSPQVYLIDQSTIYPINSLDILNAYGDFGSVQTVSQQFLSGLNMGPALGHLGQNPNGSDIYLIDSGQKIQFSSCASLANFGYSCASVPQLPPDVYSNMPTASTSVSNVIRSYTSPSEYEITNGTIQFLPNLDSLNYYNLAGTPVTYLAQSFLSGFNEGPPLVPNDTVVRDDYYGNLYLWVGSQARPIPSMALYNDLGLGSVDNFTFQHVLIAEYAEGAPLTPFVEDSSNNKYLVDSGKRLPLGSDASAWSSYYTTGIPDATINAIAQGSDPGTLIKKAGDSSIYLVQSGEKRGIAGFDDFNRLGYSFSSVTTVDPTSEGSLPTGPLQFGPLSLIQVPGSSSVQMVDGEGSWHIPSPAYATALGLNLLYIRPVDATTLAAYPSNGNIGAFVTDGTNNYLADLGMIHKLNSVQSSYGYSNGQFQTLSALAINALAHGPDLTTFIKGSGPTIYTVTGGQKDPFGSYQSYTAAGGTSSNTLTLSDGFIATLPTGPTQ